MPSHAPVIFASTLNIYILICIFLVSSIKDTVVLLSTPGLMNSFSSPNFCAIFLLLFFWVFNAESSVGLKFLLMNN